MTGRCRAGNAGEGQMQNRPLLISTSIEHAGRYHADAPIVFGSRADPGGNVRPFKLLINGCLVDGDSEMSVVNQATEEIVSKCPRASAVQFYQAIEAAHKASHGWAATPIETRRAKLLQLADLVRQNVSELARLLVQEQGKPLVQATAEIVFSEHWIRTMSAYEMSASLVENDGSAPVQAHSTLLGVVGAIVPRNFPELVVNFKLPLVLLTEGTIVVKPAPKTPLTILRFGEMCQKVFPPGVVNIVTDMNEFGNILLSHPLISKVSLSGSIDAGLKVMASAAEKAKRTTPELGGNDAAIVLYEVEDAQAKANSSAVVLSESIWPADSKKAYAIATSTWISARQSRSVDLSNRSSVLSLLKKGSSRATASSN
jgi:acyl-CoA reductase-like NAD-dependent aldehyde dehydrogenase